MKTWLLDTGPIVAYLDSGDPAHQRSAETLDSFGGHLVTTSAVITEVTHFLARHANGPALLVEFLEASGTEVAGCCGREDLQRAVGLMAKYVDTPMDFADATLVVTADALHRHHVCTLDERGFRTYRTGAGKRFSLVMDGR